MFLNKISFCQLIACQKGELKKKDNSVNTELPKMTQERDLNTQGLQVDNMF